MDSAIFPPIKKVTIYMGKRMQPADYKKRGWIGGQKGKKKLEGRTLPSKQTNWAFGTALDLERIKYGRNSADGSQVKSPPNKFA